MCGICGYYRVKPYDLETLKRMNDTMTHRGPDDSGEEIVEGKNGYYVGMAHRRLSILDLSEAGHQPMTSVNGRVTVVFNGEIYNFLDLKEQLSDYPFHTSCDTEVILAAYLKWGIECVEKFNGMFAIALLDRDDDSLYLVRDRIGKKPLYYWDRGKEGIVFSSELKPIITCPDFREEIRKDILSRFLIKQYINAPDTIFTNVKKMCNGQILRYRNGCLEEWNYWSIAEKYSSLSREIIKDYHQAKYELKNILTEAVRLRLIADVPIGSLLSGGYDSTLVSAIAQEILGSQKLNTFSIGFIEEDYNEANYAKEVANCLGTNHTEAYCSEKDMLSLVDSLPQYYDEPFADPSEIPTMLVSSIARRDVTVVLSGDGGDELFCGYNIYDLMKKLQYLELPSHIAKIVGTFGGLKDKYPNLLKAIINNKEETKTQIVPVELLDLAQSLVIDNENLIHMNYEEEIHYANTNYQIRRMLLDMNTYLPNDILTKVDRASMKYSLECRCPILDVNVIEYSFGLDHSFKYYRGDKKHILKDLTHDYVPSKIMNRPKKGFSVPLEKWIRGALREKMEYYCKPERILKQGIFVPELVSNTVNSFLNGEERYPHSNIAGLLWGFFAFQQWYEYYIEKSGEV